MRGRAPSCCDSVQRCQRARHQKIHFRPGRHVGGHEINGIADRAQQQLVRERGLIKPARERRIFGVDIKCPDHAGVAKILYLRMLRERARRMAQISRFRLIARDDVIARKDFERGERSPAGERVAGVRVRMQESARNAVVVERGINPVGGQHHRQRQITPGDTFRQAQELGGTVSKGQRGIPVVFWKFNDQEVDATQNQPKHTAPLMRSYTVFNVHQCEGLDLPELAPRPENLDVQAAVQNIINDYRDRPAINNTGEIACYIPSQDRIVMPPRSCFESDESWAGVFAHELVHSSGSSKRLKRNGVVEPIRFGSETYGLEELIAELGSAFLCADHSIELNIPRSAAYIQGWLNALKNDKSMIVKAACQAQKAVDYLSGTHCVRA